MEMKRTNLFIEKSFQTKFILKFSVLILLCSVFTAAIVMILSGRFTTVAIEGASVVIKSAEDFLAPVLALSVLTATIFCALAVMALTLVMSHKIAGPMYRMKSEIERFASGDLNANFATRKSDQLKALSGALVGMTDVYKSKRKELKTAIADLKDSIEKQAPREEVAKKADIVEHVANYFRL